MSAIASAPYKFELLAGSHIQNEIEDGKTVEKTYNRGDIFFSNEELDRKHGTEKYRRAPDYFPLKHGDKVMNPPAAPKASAKGAIPQFSTMSVEEIIEWAECEEIALDLPQGKTPSKPELIKQIRNALIPA